MGSGIHFDISALLTVILAAASAVGNQTFTYELRMDHVDTAKGARRYGPPRPSLIGWEPVYTATKRLPYRVGPGPVRVYLNVFPEGRDRRFTVAC